jgi:hypothetical protein
MKRRNWLVLGVASGRMIAALFVAGALALLLGVAALATGVSVAWGVVDLAAGVWMIADGALMLRMYRNNRTWLEAVKVFRKTLRDLPGPPTALVNDDLGLAFLHLSGRHLIFRWDALLRVATDEIDAVMRAVEDGEKAPFVVEQFEIRSGATMVFKSIEGARVQLDAGELVDADKDAPKAGLLRGMRNRHAALTSGLLQANELELAEVCAQLAGARRVTPEAEEDDRA